MGMNIVDLSDAQAIITDDVLSADLRQSIRSRGISLEIAEREDPSENRGSVGFDQVERHAAKKAFVSRKICDPREQKT